MLLIPDLLLIMTATATTTTTIKTTPAKTIPETVPPDKPFLLADLVCGSFEVTVVLSGTSVKIKVTISY